MSSPVYLHVTLKVIQSEVGNFYGAMEKAVPILEELGWKFVGAWVDRVGRLNTVIDLWELEDANMYWTVLKEFSKHPEHPAILAVFDTAIEEEVVHMMDKVPYARR